MTTQTANQAQITIPIPARIVAIWAFFGRIWAAARHCGDAAIGLFRAKFGAWCTAAACAQMLKLVILLNLAAFSAMLLLRGPFSAEIAKCPIVQCPSQIYISINRNGNIEAVSSEEIEDVIFETYNYTPPNEEKNNESIKIIITIYVSAFMILAFIGFIFQ